MFATHGEAWLTAAVKIGETFKELQPAQRIGSVPYAVRAVSAARVGVSRSWNNSPAVVYASNAVFKGGTDGSAPTGFPAPTIVAGGNFISGDQVTTADRPGETKGHFRYTSSLTGTEVEGYQAAKHACEAALGSKTARMCTNLDMVRSVQLGIPLPAQDWWIATGTYAEDRNGSDKRTKISDCEGWRTSQDQDSQFKYAGQAWRWSGAPVGQACNVTLPIACCDY